MLIDWKNPDYTPIFAERLERLKKLKASPEKIPYLKQYYRDNFGQFTNDWGCTYDPRLIPQKLPALIPFIMFPRQMEFMEWLNERFTKQENGLVEKSRDMGITWLTVAAAAEYFLFHSGMAIGFCSRKAEYVDSKGNLDSIFEKIRMYLRYIPREFLPYGKPTAESGYRIYSEAKDATQNKIINIENGSTITGESGDDVGRGGRKTIYFKDESAHYEHADKIDTALSETTNCQIDMSSVNGEGNAFHRKRMSGVIPVFVFDWSEDPRKGPEWFEYKKRVTPARIFAQEVLRDYGASVEDVCIPPKWVQAAVMLHEKINAVPTGMKRCGFDVADEIGEDKNAVAFTHGVVVQEVESWGDLDTHQSTMKVAAYAENMKAAYVNYDSIGVGAGVRASAKFSSVDFYPVTSSNSPTSGYVINDTGKLNVDHYLNLRAQMWWEMRVRCERAYQHINGIQTYSLDDMVSLPNSPEVISQLSRPKVEFTAAGKIQIESKEKMKKRGIASPNEAEAVIYSLRPPPSVARRTFSNYAPPRML